jgi:hypothetical protein
MNNRRRQARHQTAAMRQASVKTANIKATQMICADASFRLPARDWKFVAASRGTVDLRMLSPSNSTNRIKAPDCRGLC